MNALLAMTDFLTVLQMKEMLAEKDFSRFERPDGEDDCATLLDHLVPDLVVIDADATPVRPSWLIGLCLARGCAVLALTDDHNAESSDPSVVVLHKPYMKQQARVAIEDALSRRSDVLAAKDTDATARPH